MKTKFFAALLMAPLLFIASCKKDSNGGYATGRVTAKMTDAPTPYGYEEVNIDVRSIEVHIAGSTGGDWYRLHTAAGIYNVLTLCNGIDTMLADEAVPTGQVTQLRLNLGPNNSLRRNGVLYPLAVPSGEESGLKVQINEMIGPGQLDLIVDFDAAQSVVEDGHGSYHLRPVIHAYTEGRTGTVAGSIPVPDVGVALVFNNGEGTYTTYASSASGQFMARGLTPGIYSLTVYSAAGATVFHNISVQAGQTVNMGVLDL